MVHSAVDTLQVREQGSAIEALYARGTTWVAFRPIADASRIDFKLRKFPEIGLLSGKVQGVRHEHSSKLSNADDSFSFHINLSGESIVTGRGREFTLRAGEAMLLDYSVARTISRPGLVDHAVVRLPRAALAPLVTNIDDALLRPIARNTGALGLLTSYVAAVIDDPALSSLDLRRLISNQLADLAAVTLNGSRDAIAIAEDRGVRAARLRAIESDIEAHLGDPGLSQAIVAARQCISDSYIRKLFEAEGTSFSEFVLSRRLARAYRMLADPRCSRLKIAAVAFDCGFGDLSYFNRTFKRVYGARPSEVRAGAY